MIFFCNGCEKDQDHALLSILIIEKWGHGIKRYCKECRSPSAGVPDVFFDGKPEEGLADDLNTGQPHVFFSRGQKAQYLKDRGLMEAGDRVHGAPVMTHQNQNRRVDTRHEVQMALKKVKDMGRDNRRSEYQRIIKEGRNAESRR